MVRFILIENIKIEMILVRAISFSALYNVLLRVELECEANNDQSYCYFEIFFPASQVAAIDKEIIQPTSNNLGRKVISL